MRPTLSGLTTHPSFQAPKRNWNWDKEAQPSNDRSFMGSNFGELLCNSQMSVVNLPTAVTLRTRKNRALMHASETVGYHPKNYRSWTLDMFKNEDGSNEINRDSWIFIHPNMLCFVGFDSSKKNLKPPEKLGHPAVLPK